MCRLAQHRGGVRFCTRGDVLDFSIRYKIIGVCKNRDTRRESPAGAGAGRTANHLTVLFSQKILAVRRANCIYRFVSCWAYYIIHFLLHYMASYVHLTYVYILQTLN